MSTPSRHPVTSPSPTLRTWWTFMIDTPRTVLRGGRFIPTRMAGASTPPPRHAAETALPIGAAIQSNLSRAAILGTLGSVDRHAVAICNSPALMPPAAAYLPP
ncbi:MAG: hypothetical protein WKG07_45965 [Hymenobacter sp.]